ncbi:MAG: O-antigen ligase family protein [Patescibacteria group bacterium]|nr:O-antigen ligase family protein [Patescibacteria group bacterium]
MVKKILLISILILLFGILIPLFSNWGDEGWGHLLLTFGIIFGLAILIFLYLKNPVFVLILIPPAIVFGQIATIRIQDWYYQVSLAEILVIILTLFFILKLIAQKQFKQIRFPLLLGCFLLYIFLSVLSLGWADNLSRAVIALRNLGFHFLILLLAVNLIKNKRDFKIALFSIPITGLLVATQLIFKVISLGGFQGDYALAREAIITPVGKWVYIAAIIIMTLPFTYILLLTTRNKWLKMLLFAETIVGGMATFLTLGKGEIFSLMAGFIYIFRKQKVKKLFAILFICVLLAVIAIPLASYSDKFLDRLTRVLTDPNTRFRIVEFRSAYQIFVHNPILGVGTGNLKLEYKNLLPWSVETESNNFFLQVLLELGIIGFAAFMLVIRAIYLEIKKAQKISLNPEEKMLYLGFVSTLIIVLLNSMVEATLIGLYYGMVFWYIIGLLAIYNQLINQKNAK